MCGRFTQTATPEHIAHAFRLLDLPLLATRYNIAPSQLIAAVRIDPETSIRRLVMLRWGLIPSWTKDPKSGPQSINAKSETVAEKPSFRSAFKRRRCLVVTTGFYEWQPQGQTKQPMWIGFPDRRPFAFAGLWERWQPAEGDPIESCTILTTGPNTLMEPIHNRMPVILPSEAYDPWMDPTVQDTETLKPLLCPYHRNDLVAYPVSTLVNNPRNDVAQCLEAIPAA